MCSVPNLLALPLPQEQEQQQEVMDDDKEVVMKKQYITKKQDIIPWRCVRELCCN